MATGEYEHVTIDLEATIAILGCEDCGQFRGSQCNYCNYYTPEQMVKMVRKGLEAGIIMCEDGIGTKTGVNEALGIINRK